MASDPSADCRWVKKVEDRRPDPLGFDSESVQRRPDHWLVGHVQIFEGRLLMNDLTGAAERRTTIALALLVITVLLLPIGALAETAVEPMSRPDTEEGSDTSSEDDPELVDQIDAVVPTVPGHGDENSDGEGTPDSDPSEEPEESTDPDAAVDGPREVEAEGDDTQEVVAPPVAPAPEVREEEGQDAPADAAEDGVADDAAEDVALEPLPPEAFGPQLNPSLGTATAPVTQPLTGFDGNAPLVLAPQIAADGSPIAPGAVGATTNASIAPGLLGLTNPSRSATAASLSVVQPSWYATVAALLVLFGAGAYGAVLRRRGQAVPEALAIPTAVRPGDAPVLLARSVRPADIGPTSARSIRP